MFVLLEAVLEKCYTVLRDFFPSELCRACIVEEQK